MAQTQDRTTGTKITVQVIYNGVTESIEVQPQATVEAALNHAMNEFGIRDQRHIQAFFREDGSEVIPLTISAREAGFQEGMLLALRPSLVRGGRA